jgi:hypothetical protein
MRRLTTAVGAGTLLLALAACGQQPDDVGFGGQPPAPPGPVEPKPEAQRRPVAQDAVDVTALPKSYPKKVWTQDDGRAVGVIGQEGGCSKVHPELAEQTDEHVKIILVEETPEPPGICTMDLRYPPLALRLSEPLDGRKVVLEQRDVKVPR